MRGLPGSLAFADFAAVASDAGAAAAGAGAALAGAGQSAAAGLLPFLPLLVFFVFLVGWQSAGWAMGWSGGGVEMLTGGGASVFVSLVAQPPAMTAILSSRAMLEVFMASSLFENVCLNTVVGSDTVNFVFRAHYDCATLVNPGWRNVENTLIARGCGAARLFNNECHRVGFVHQA